jgi:Protein of unknown function (DUF3120)
LSSYTSTPSYAPVNTLEELPLLKTHAARQRWFTLLAAIVLVSVPVFFQAPLVKVWPGFSLILTAVWLGLALWMRSRPGMQLWGDLLVGFSWTWLAGSIYWGWFRWEPYFHLPLEAIGLPIVLVLMVRGWGTVGNFFYLGSLFGTALTDVYFYIVGLIPHWRQLMRVDPSDAGVVLHAALQKMDTPLGMASALTLILLLIGVGTLPLYSRAPHWWAFGGAVLSTILVDGLFWVAAIAS